VAAGGRPLRLRAPGKLPFLKPQPFGGNNVERGRFLPGRLLEARPMEVRVGFLDYQAAGAGRVAWEVLARQGGVGTPSSG
jgi:hypothetical protein